MKPKRFGQVQELDLCMCVYVRVLGEWEKLHTDVIYTGWGATGNSLRFFSVE